MKTTINTLDQLAEVINANEDYPVDTVTEAIERNGWEDLQGTEFDVCSDGKEMVSFDSNGEARVVPID